FDPFYKLQFVRVNEKADIEELLAFRTTASSDKTAFDVEVTPPASEDDNAAYTVYVVTDGNNDKTDISVNLTAESTNGTVELLKDNVQIAKMRDESDAEGEGVTFTKLDMGNYQLVVTSEDGNTTKTYTLKLIASSSDAAIKSIIFNKGTDVQFNSAKQKEVEWDGAVIVDPSVMTTIEIIPTNNYATITDIVRVRAKSVDGEIIYEEVQDSDPVIEDDINNKLLVNNKVKGAVQVDYKTISGYLDKYPDGDLYLVTIASQDGKQIKTEPLRIKGKTIESKEIGLNLVTVDGKESDNITSDGYVYNFKNANDKVSAAVETAGNSRIVLIKDKSNMNGTGGIMYQAAEVSSAINDWMDTYKVNLKNYVNEITVDVISDFYVSDTATPNSKKTYTIALYTTSDECEIKSITVGGKEAVRRSDNPTVFDIAVGENETYKDTTNNLVSDVVVTAMNAYTEITKYGTSVPTANGELKFTQILSTGSASIRIDAKSSSGNRWQTYTLNISLDDSNADVKSVFVNETELEPNDEVYVDLQLFALERTNEAVYTANVNRRDNVNITILPKAALATVTLSGDNIDTPVSKLKGGVFENIVMNETTDTNLFFTITAADGITTKDYKIVLHYMGDTDTGIQGAEYAGIEAGKAINDENVRIVNMVGSKLTSGLINIYGNNKNQLITITIDGKEYTSENGVLSQPYSMINDMVELPFTVTSQGSFNNGTFTGKVTEDYTLVIRRKTAGFEEVAADSNVLEFNTVQYSYTALPTAKKVAVYVKADDEYAKVKIGGNNEMVYEALADIDISTLTSVDELVIPIQISTYPYLGTDTDTVVRNLVIKKGSSTLKNLSVMTKPEIDGVDEIIQPNEYGEYIRAIDADNNNTYLTVRLQASSDKYKLVLYDNSGTAIESGTYNQSEGEDIKTYSYTIDSKELSAPDSENKFSIYVSDGIGNEAVYPLIILKASTDTSVKEVIAQRHQLNESIAENKDVSDEDCAEHVMYIDEDAVSVNMYIAANDPNAVVTYDKTSRTGELYVDISLTDGAESYRLPFTITSKTMNSITNQYISQTHYMVLIRRSSIAELESVNVNGELLENSNDSYSAKNITTETVKAIFKAAHNGTVEVFDKSGEAVPVAPDTNEGSVWTKDELPLEDGASTRYVIRVTSQDKNNSKDYMLTLEPEDFIGGLKLLEIAVDPADLSNIGYIQPSRDEDGVYNYIIDETAQEVYVHAVAWNMDSVVSINNDKTNKKYESTLKIPLNGNVTTVPPTIKTIYIPVTVKLNSNGYVYDYVLKLERRNLNTGDITVEVGDDLNSLTSKFEVIDNNTLYSAIVAGTEHEDGTVTAGVKVSAGDIYAMVAGELLSDGARVPEKTDENVFEKEVVLESELTQMVFTVRAEDASADEYVTIYLDIYKANNNSALKDVTVDFERNGETVAISAQKKEADDGTIEYHTWISTESDVNITAEAEALGAMVQIEGNSEAVYHIDRLENIPFAGQVEKIITVMPSDGSPAAEYKLIIHKSSMELLTLTVEGNDVLSSVKTEDEGGKFVDVYEYYTSSSVVDIFAEAQASVEIGVMPGGAKNPDADSLFVYEIKQADVNGYAEYEIKVRGEGVTDEFIKVSKLRIYNYSEDNTLSSVEISYKDKSGNVKTAKAAVTADGNYEFNLPNYVELADITATAADMGAGVKVEPNTEFNIHVDTAEDVKLASGTSVVNITVHPSAASGQDKTYTLTIYRLDTALASVVVDSAELYPTTKTETIDGVVYDLYETVVSNKESASITVKTLDGDAIVNVSADGTDPDASSTNVWTNSNYALDNITELVISVKRDAASTAVTKSLLRIYKYSNNTAANIFAEYTDAEGNIHKIAAETDNVDTSYDGTTLQIIVPYDVNTIDLTAQTSTSLAGVKITEPDEYGNPVSNVVYNTDTDTVTNYHMAQSVSTRYVHVKATDNTTTQIYKVNIVHLANLVPTDIIFKNNSTTYDYVTVEDGKTVYNKLATSQTSETIEIKSNSYVYISANDGAWVENIETTTVSLAEGITDVIVKTSVGQTLTLKKYQPDVLTSIIRIYNLNDNTNIKDISVTYKDNAGQSVDAVIVNDPVNGYTAFIPEGTKLANVYAQTEDVLANIKINDGKYEINKTTYNNINVSAADNTAAEISVKATDGTEKAYTLTISTLKLAPTIETWHDGEAKTAADYDSVNAKFTTRVTPGGQIKLDITPTDAAYYVRYGYIPNTEDNYETIASNYKDSDSRIVWSEWKQGGITEGLADLITGDNKSTKIVVQVGVPNNSESIDEPLGDNLGKLGTNRKYSLFVYQKYDSQNEIEISVNDNKITGWTDNSGVKEVYYGVLKTDEDKIKLMIESVTTAANAIPLTSYTVDSPSAHVDDVEYKKNYDVAINPVEADPDDTPHTVINITAKTESGKESYYRIIVYRKSSNANIETITVNEKAQIGDTILENNTYYHKFNVPSNTVVSDSNGNEFVKIYIDAVHEKANIHLNVESLKNKDYIGKTETTEGGNTLEYVLVPVTFTNNTANVEFTVTSEDKLQSVLHNLVIKKLSSSTGVDSVTIYGVTNRDAEYVAEYDEDGNLVDEYFKGYLSTDEIGNDNGSVIISVYAEDLDASKSVVSLSKQFEVTYADPDKGTYVGGEDASATRNTYWVSNRYTGLKSMVKGDVTVTNFTITAESGETKTYELRLYAMDTDNRNIEVKEYEVKDDKGNINTMSIPSIWVAEQGTLGLLQTPSVVSEGIDPDDKVTPTYTVYIGDTLTSIDIKVRTEYEYAGVRINNAKNYDYHEQTLTISNLKPNTEYTYPIYVRSQNEMSATTSSSTGYGKLYKLIIKRLPDNRELQSVTISPADMKEDPSEYIEENESQYIVSFDSSDVIPVVVNHGTEVVPIRFVSMVKTARITVSGELIDSQTSVSATNVLDARLMFTGENSQSYTIKVENREGDLTPKEYTLVLSRKNNVMNIDNLLLDGRITVTKEEDKPKNDTDPLIYYIDIAHEYTGYKDEDGNVHTGQSLLKATTLDPTQYVDINNDGVFTQALEESLVTLPQITTDKYTEYSFYIGSSNLINGVPDQLRKVILKLKRKPQGAIIDDLQIQIYVSHIENDNTTARKAELSTLGGDLSDPATYEVLINQNAVDAYVSVSNNFKTTKLEAYNMDTDGTVTDKIGSGIQLMNFVKAMGDGVSVTVRINVTAGDGTMKPYNLIIRKNSNDASLKFAKADNIKDWANNQFTTENEIGETVNVVKEAYAVSSTDNMYTYRLELPDGSGYTNLKLQANNKYAHIQLEVDGKYVDIATDDQSQYERAAITVNNVRQTDIKFRIVPVSVLYDPSIKLADTYSSKDTCNYYTIEIINTPNGTQIQDIFVNYKDNPNNKATVTSQTTFAARVPEVTVSTPIQIVAKDKNASIWLTDDPNQIMKTGVYTIDDYVLDEGLETELGISVKSVSGIVVNYKLTIIKQTEDKYDTLQVFVNGTRAERDPVNNKLFVRAEKLPSYLTEVSAKAMLIPPEDNTAHRIVIGEESETNTGGYGEETNNHVPLTGAETYIPLTIYDGAASTQFQILVLKNSVDNLLASVLVDNQVPTELNTTESGNKSYEAHVYSIDGTAKVHITANDTRAIITLTRVEGKEAQNIWRNNNDGKLYAGVTDLAEGDNNFTFTIRTENTPETEYHLNIIYTKLQAYLDDLAVSVDGENIPFEDKLFNKKVLDYEISTSSLDSSTSNYTISASAKTLIDDLKEVGLDEEVTIQIGDNEPQPVTEGQTTVTDIVTIDPTEHYVSVPVVLALGDYTRTYTIFIHNKSNDATLLHTGEGGITEIGLGVKGYELTPEYTWDADKQEYYVEVESTIPNVDIYAIANHIHENSSTILSLMKLNDKGSYTRMASRVDTLTETVDLDPGINIFRVTVLSEDGTATKNYELSIYKKSINMELKTLLVNDLPAKYDRVDEDGRNVYIAYALPGTVNVKALAKDWKGVGVRITSDNDSTETAYQNAGISTPLSMNMTQTSSGRTATITLSNSDGGSKDYKLELIVPKNGILNVLIDVDDGRFETDTTKPYNTPITAVWVDDYKGTGKGAYVAGVPNNKDAATIRMTLAEAGKIVRIGSFVPQANDYDDDLGVRFTAKGTVQVPEMTSPIVLAVADKDEYEVAEKLGQTYEFTELYDLYIEKLSDEAYLYNAELAEDYSFGTIDKLQQTYSVNIPNEVTSLTFENVVYSDKATASVTINKNSKETYVEVENGGTFTITDIPEGSAFVNIKITSEDKTQSRVYNFSIMRAKSTRVAMLNDIQVIINGDITDYEDTVAVFDRNFDSDIMTYRYAIPQEIDEGETPIVIKAIADDLINSDGTGISSYIIKSRTTINGEAIASSESSEVEIKEKLSGGDVVRVVFNVSKNNMLASEYAVELFKNADVNLNPKLAYITNMVLDSGEKLTRTFVNNQYDYNYYTSVSGDTNIVRLSMSMNFAAYGHNAYLIDKSGNRTFINDYSNIELILPEAGDNIFMIEVSDGEYDGTGAQNKRYFSIKINKEAQKMEGSNNNALLKSISSDNYSLLTGMFRKNKNEYFLAIPYNERTLSLKAIAEDENATIRIRKEGGEFLKEAAGGRIETADIPLERGSNRIVITVTASDNITKSTYIIDAHQAVPDHTGDIIKLDYTDTGKITPLFNSKITNYFISYPYDTDTITFTPTLRPEEVESVDEKGNRIVSHIYVSNSNEFTAPTELESGETYTFKDVPYGDSEIMFKVVTFNGTTKLYSVTVNRARANERPELEHEIEVFSSETGSPESKYELSRIFYNDEYAYYLNVPYETTRVWVKTTVSDSSYNSIKLNDEAVASGELVLMDNLVVGDTLAVVQIGDKADITHSWYTVVINRSEQRYDEIPQLEGLEVLQEEFGLVPSFESDIYDYVVVVDQGTEYINLVPDFASDYLVTINNINTASGTPSDNLDLKVGENYVDVVVSGISEDTPNQPSKTRSHYVVKVIRPEATAVLDYIGINEGSMAPVFEPGIRNYYVTVPNDIDEIEITVEPTDGTSIAAGGHNAVYDSDTNIITVNPTAESDTVVMINVYADGCEYTSNVYSIAISRRGTVTNLVDLKSLSVDGYKLTTEFAPRDVNYYVYVPSDTETVTINAEAEHSDTQIKGVGNRTLLEGTTAFVITAENGTSKQRYSLTVIREGEDKLTALTADTADITPEANVYSGVYATNNASIDLSVDAADEIRINGHRVNANDINTYALTADNEKFDIRVKGEDGSDYVYTLFAQSDETKEGYGQYLSDIIVETGSVQGTGRRLLNYQFSNDRHEYMTTVNQDDIWLFARPYKDGEGNYDDTVLIEMFDEELNDYTIAEFINPYIHKTLTKDITEFKFRATRYAESGYENISEYVLKVYRAQAPVLSDLSVENAVMYEAFDPFVNEYTVSISKDTTTFSAYAEADYENAQIVMNITPKDTTPEGEYDTADASNPHTRVFTPDELPLDVENFVVKVKLTANGEDNIYVLNVTRSDVPISNIYLENIEVVDETSEDDGLYELDRIYDKQRREYHTTVNYIDNSIELILTAENEDDEIYVEIGDTSAVLVPSGEKTSFLLPVSFLLDDDAEERIKITVRNADGQEGRYDLVVNRAERLDGIARLENLETDPELDTPFVKGQEDTVYTYAVTASVNQKTIDILPTPLSPADTVVITHNGVSTGNVASANTTFDLTEGQRKDVFFVTVSNSGSDEFTYVVIVNRENTAMLTDIRVTDDDDTDEYFVLNPEFTDSVVEYTVKVPALADEIEFTVETSEATSVLKALLENTEFADATGTQLVAKSGLALDKNKFKFSFTVEDAMGGFGNYNVTVVREAEQNAPSIQTYIKGTVHTESDNNHAEIDLYLTDEFDLDDTIAPIMTVNTNTDENGISDGTFELMPAKEGIYTIVIRREGYLNYYIRNIVITKTYAKAEYDFGRRDLYAGDIITTGSSKDIIDEQDLEALVKIMNGETVMINETTGNIINVDDEPMMDEKSEETTTESDATKPETGTETGEETTTGDT
ncbi:MAG: cadherin-like beta sandwich domain-containing protein, partial [Hominilimicola sp.]